MLTRRIIGSTAGFHAEGVDAVLLEIEGVGLDLRARVLCALHQPFGPDLLDLVRRASPPASVAIGQVSLLHRLLGETFAAAARAVADKAKLGLAQVLCIGCSGHVAWHEGRFPACLCLGMPAVVAERTGLTTLGDFVSRDLAAGGHGGPLFPLPDLLLFRHAHESRLIVHLGATTKVAYIPAGCRSTETVAFEAGPGTALLDSLMRQLTGGRTAFDAGGKHAVQGRCVEALLEKWLGHGALQQRPPRTLPQTLFGEEFAAAAVQEARRDNIALHDLLCTATHFVARGLLSAVHRWLPPGFRFDRVLLSGGGVRNGLLWRLLDQQFVGLALERTDAAGVPADGREAAAMGVLAALTLDGVPGNLPSATGASGSRLLGSLVPGSSANWYRCLSWMASQAGPIPA